MQAEFLEYSPLQAFLALSASGREEMKQREEEYQKRAKTNQHLDPSEKSNGVVQPMKEAMGQASRDLLKDSGLAPTNSTTPRPRNGRSR